MSPTAFVFSLPVQLVH